MKKSQRSFLEFSTNCLWLFRVKLCQSLSCKFPDWAWWKNQIFKLNFAHKLRNVRRALSHYYIGKLWKLQDHHHPCNSRTGWTLFLIGYLWNVIITHSDKSCFEKWIQSDKISQTKATLRQIFTIKFPFLIPSKINVTRYKLKIQQENDFNKTN